MTLAVQPSRLWACLVLIFAIIFIAAYAINTPANGQFDLKNGLLGLLSLWVAVGLLRLALCQPRGVLRCAATNHGSDPLNWSWQAAGAPLEAPVTLHLALDVQQHLLLRLAPVRSGSQAPAQSLGLWRAGLRCLWPRSQWLWLERSQPALTPHWPQLRRGVYWRAKPSRPNTAPGQGQQNS